MSSQLRSVLRSATLFHRQRRTLPQTLIFFVTSRCNARCSFCLYYEQITNPVAKSKELRVDEVEQIARKYGPLHYLALSGGEPFVRKDLEGVCQAFITHCQTSVVDIPSNFYYGDTMVDTLSPLVRKNPDVVFDIQLSIDHIDEKHDESRRVKGLYAKAIESFRRLAEIREQHPNLKLKISIVYLDSNKDELEMIAERIRSDFKCDRIQLTYPHKVLPTEGEPSLEAREDIERYKREASRLAMTAPVRRFTDLHTIGVRSVKKVYHDLLDEAVAGVRPTGSYCGVGKLLVVINEKGDVFPCEPLWQAVGNLREVDYDMNTILESPAYTAFKRKYLESGGCNCTWSCAMNTYISVTPRFFPKMAVEASRILVHEVAQHVRR